MPALARGVKSPAELKADELRKRMGVAAPLSKVEGSPTGSTLPSRDRVSAAIALVRARQAARCRSSNASEQLLHELPKSPRAAITTTIIASRNTDKASPARSPLSLAKRSSPSRLGEVHIRNMRRSPLSPKAQDPQPSTGVESPRTGELHDGIASPPKSTPTSPKTGAFFSDAADGNSDGRPAMPTLTQRDDSNNQENTPEDDRHETDSPVSNRIELVSNIRATPSPASLSPIVPAETVCASNDSDDCTLDTQMLDDVGRFIDAVHNKQRATIPVIHPIEKKSTSQSAREPLLRPNSSESTDNECIPVSPETLADIGQYIDAMAKPKKKSIQSSESTSTDGDDTIPVETKVGIGAFIDALHTKSPPLNEAKNTLYLSSSDDSSMDQNGISDVDAYYQRGSTDNGPGGDDDDLRLLEEVLSDRVETGEKDVNGHMSILEDPSNPAFGISAPPSDLEGDDFFSVDPLPGTQDATKVNESEVNKSEILTQSDGDGSLSTRARASTIPCNGNLPSGRNDENQESDVNVYGAEGFEMTFVGNSDDALDDAVNAALIEEMESSFSNEEVIVRECNVTVEGYPPLAIFQTDLGVSEESYSGKETTLPSENSEKVEIPFIRENGADQLFANPTPSGGEIEEEITAISVNSFANDDKIEVFFSGEEYCADELYQNPASQSNEAEADISAIFAPLHNVKMCRVDKSREIDMDTSELVNAFLGVTSTTGKVSNLIGVHASEADVSSCEILVPQDTNQTHEPWGGDPVDNARSIDVVLMDGSPSCGTLHDPIAANRSEQVSEVFNFDLGGGGSQFEGESSSDDDAGELLNAFLNGSTAAVAPIKSPSRKPAPVRSPTSKAAGIDDDIMEEVVSKIGAKSAAVFVHLSWGASSEKIKTLNAFIKAAVPFLSGQSAPLVAEAQVRSVAFRVGLATDDVEQVIDHVFGEYVNEILESRSADTADLANILNDSKFESIEEIDETANISAFLSRMNALEAGGHFGETDVADATADEAVEVDLDLGFVNRILEPVGSEEAPWWDEDVAKGSANQTKASSSQVQIMTIDEPVSSPRQHERTETQRSHSESPRKSRIPRSSEVDPEQVRALQNQKAQISSQQRLENARTFMLNSLSIDDVPPSLSLTKVPSLIGDIETMLEARENSISRSKNAKQAKWISPWEKRWISSGTERKALKPITMMKFEGSKAPRLEGVAAAIKLSNWTSRPERHDRRLPVKQQWRLAYKERTKDHPGYSMVDVFSLYDASIVIGERHPYDDEPWEYRDVKQRFLHEQSISMSRNWFGAVLRKRGNDRYREPVANPKSMEMPMENLPGEGEWLEEWYTTWQQRHNETKKKSKAGQDAGFDSDSEDSDGSETCNTYTVYTEGETTRGDDDTETYSRSVYTGVSGSVYTSRRSQRSRYTRRSQGYEEDDDSWEEDPPECGTFQNVKQKIGERLSLVRYEHLSSLRQSRWRKRYFPRGTFPYK